MSVPVCSLNTEWSLLPVQEADLKDYRSAGQVALERHRVAVVLLAGGHGSRLGSSQPKGCCPLSPVRQQSLFGLFAEQLAVGGQRLGEEIPCVVWINREQESATRTFWAEADSWGLNPTFVVQPELPLLDEQYQPILVDGKLVGAPNGNGSLWQTLDQQGILSRWEQSGVQVVVVVPIDNPLAQPLDPIAVGALIHHDCQALLVAGQRLTAEESVGVILPDEQRIAEYGELPQKAREESGLRNYPYGYLGVSLWRIEMARQAAQTTIPRHLAWKTVDIQGQKRSCWKQEYFIFDLLAARSGVGVMPVDRCLRFAPLKSASGPFGLEATQQAMVQAAQKRLQQLGQSDVATIRELHPLFWVTEVGSWTCDERGWVEPSKAPTFQ